MAPSPTTRDRVAAHLRIYRAAAEQIVAELQERGFVDDPADVAEHAQASLAVAAQHELLQALTQIHLEADLFVHHAARQGAGGSEATPEDAADDALLQSAERMRETVARATAVTRVYLDRAETNRLLIRLDLTPVDLTQLLENHLRAGHLWGTPYVRTMLAPAAVEGDAAKLVAVFDHLLGRLLRRRRADQTVQVHAGDGTEDETEVFLGLAPWPDGPESLIGEMSAPFRLEGIGIDVPYARAVVERHGGRFVVGRTEDGGAGYRLVFPRRRSATKEVVS